MTVDELRMPGHWEDVSADWMTAALTPSHPGIEVDGVELLLVDDGTNRRARFGLSYARGEGPATVFLKAGDPAHAELNARMGGIFNEPRLFRSGLTLPLEHPAVHLALIDEPALDFLLVMEDVAGRGGDPRDATRPVSVDQAASALSGLARLHSRWWGDRIVDEPALAWVEPFAAWGTMARGVDIGIERAGDRLPPEVVALGGEAIDRGWWVRWAAALAGGPTTLLHGDPHIGNTYVLPDHTVGFLDWQVVRRGGYSLDLAYFLQGALTIDDRRASESDLVAHYRESLEVPHDERPTADELWRDYRASTIHGLNLWLATAASRWQRPEVSLTLAERYAAAFVDLDTTSAIEALEAAG